MKFKKILLSVFLIFGSQCYAQTKVTGSEVAQRFSLRACIDYAINNNVSLKQSQMAVESGIVQLNQSKVAKLPTANGQFNLNGNAGRNVDPFTNGIVTNTIGTNNMGVGLSMPIFDGNRNKITVERSQLSLEAAQMDVATQKNNVSLQVTVAYLNVLSAEDLIDVAQKQLDVTKLQYERTQKLVDAGSLPETNLFDLDAQIANDELSLINAQNSLESAILTLKQAMNAPVEMNVQVSRIVVPDPNIINYGENANSVYQTAVGYLPEVKAGEIRLKAADKNIAIAKSLGLPSLSANTSWGTAFSSAAKRLTETGTTSNPIPVSAQFDGQTIPFVINFPQTSFASDGIPYFRQFLMVITKNTKHKPPKYRKCKWICRIRVSNYKSNKILIKHTSLCSTLKKDILQHWLKQTHLRGPSKRPNQDTTSVQATLWTIIWPKPILTEQNPIWLSPNMTISLE
jgi:outer membrane protein